MKGYAYPDAELADLLPSDLSAYDQHFWIIETRGGWHPSCASPSPQDYEDLDEVLGRALIQGESFACALVDVGRFSKIAPCIGLDEWTYLVAISCDYPKLESVLRDRGITDFLSANFFDSVAQHNATLIAYIDGWWECFPESSPLLGGFGVGFHRSETNSQKWADFNQDPQSPIRPDFKAKPCVATGDHVSS